jgi:hypothetical protein
MRIRQRVSRSGFFSWTAIWAGGLLLVNLIHQLTSGLLDLGLWSPLEVLFLLPGWAGLLLPYAAFAGGLAAHGTLSVPSVVKRGIVIAVVSYLLLAYGSPLAEYRIYASRDTDLAALFPYGPTTPSALLAIRSAVEAGPPDRYNFRIDRPLEQPPNWLTYLLHSVAAIAFYSVVAALLGQLSGKLTTGLSPPNRRNARWALGLVGAIAFFVAEAAGGEWVRADALNSGVLGAWLPMIVPAVELGLFAALARARGRDQSSPVSSEVQ